MVKSDNSIGHYALTQKDAAGVLHIDGRPTGEFTVAGTIEYLQSRQPGWPEVLIQGLPGIKVSRGGGVASEHVIDRGWFR